MKTINAKRLRIVTPRCPECKTGHLEIVPDGLVGRVYHPGYHVAGTELPRRFEAKPFAACTACEFCLELSG